MDQFSVCCRPALHTRSATKPSAVGSRAKRRTTLRYGQTSIQTCGHSCGHTVMASSGARRENGGIPAPTGRESSVSGPCARVRKLSRSGSAAMAVWCHICQPPRAHGVRVGPIAPCERGTAPYIELTDMFSLCSGLPQDFSHGRHRSDIHAADVSRPWNPNGERGSSASPPACGCRRLSRGSPPPWAWPPSGA